MVTQKITINLTQSRLAPIIMRSEEKGREIQFEVIDEAGEPEDLTGYSLKYMQLKPDGNVVYADLASGILTQTEQMATSKGKGYYCIRIMDDDTIIYSGQGPVVIDDHVIDDETLESISEVNGLIFPDDFLTDEDMGDYVTDDELATALSDYVTNDGLSTVLADYATTDYVDDAISHIQTLDVYSTEEKVVGTWIDGRSVYEKTFTEIPLGYDGSYTLISSGIDIAFLVSNYYETSGTHTLGSPSYISRYGAGGNCSQYLDLTNHSLIVWNNSTTSILWTGTVRYVKSV